MKATTCLSYWLKFNHPDITKCGPGYETTRSFTYWWWECKVVQKLWRAVQPFLMKVNIHLSYNTGFAFLGKIYLFQKSENFYLHKNLYTNIHSKFFIIVRNWKPPKYPTIGEWFMKYSEIKRNELLIHRITSMDFTLSGEQKTISKGTYCTIPFT